MEKEILNIEAKLQFRGIELLHCNTSYTKVDNQNIIFNFDITSEIQVSAEHKMVMVIIGVKIFDNDKANLLGDVATNCMFFIENFSEIITTKADNTFVIPDNLLIVLNSISLSTTRGILWSSFRGTPLHTALLPIVDPKLFKPQIIAQ
jgi:hypothetical protein